MAGEVADVFATPHERSLVSPSNLFERSKASTRASNRLKFQSEYSLLVLARQRRGRLLLTQQHAPHLANRLAQTLFLLDEG